MDQGISNRNGNECSPDIFFRVINAIRCPGYLQYKRGALKEALKVYLLIFSSINRLERLVHSFSYFSAPMIRRPQSSAPCLDSLCCTRQSLQPRSIWQSAVCEACCDWKSLHCVGGIGQKNQLAPCHASVWVWATVMTTFPFLCPVSTYR